MYIRMNHYIELLLAASIVVLLMHVPEFLQEMAASSLGKMLLLSVVVFLLCFCGKNAGILAAVIYIIVVYKTDRDQKMMLVVKLQMPIIQNGIVQKRNVSRKQWDKEKD